MPAQPTEKATPHPATGASPPPARRDRNRDFNSTRAHPFCSVLRLLRLQHLRHRRLRRHRPRHLRRRRHRRNHSSPPAPSKYPASQNAPYTPSSSGGTPANYPARDLVRILQAASTCSASSSAKSPKRTPTPSPADLQTDAVSPASFFVQSVVPEVLQVLDRTHTPSNVPRSSPAKEV